MATPPLKLLTKKGVLICLFPDLKTEKGYMLKPKNMEDIQDKIRLLHLNCDEQCDLERKCSAAGFETVTSAVLIDHIRKVRGQVKSKDMLKKAKELCDKMKLGLCTEKALKLVALAQSLVKSSSVTKKTKCFPVKDCRAMKCLCRRQNWYVPRVIKGYEYKTGITQEIMVDSWKTIGGTSGYIKAKTEDIISKYNTLEKKRNPDWIL